MEEGRKTWREGKREGSRGGVNREEEKKGKSLSKRIRFGFMYLSKVTRLNINFIWKHVLR